ncbi:MAG: [FeFe] hydrogenase, group A [Clostridiales bacterium]|nr:[FeFe] hydrogenase, group A [Clostridiales bacterium]
MSNTIVIVDKIPVPIEGEKNLLEVIRKAGIELPTFCYHSEISVYGACRMCMVEVEGRGILAACSTAAEDGMVVHTNTKQVHALRKMIIELMLASHDQTCTVCPKSGSCRLQTVAQQLGVKETRFKTTELDSRLDVTGTGVVRRPDKCILCGDCVRVCSELQSIGVLDFAYRGAQARVVTSFDKDMGEVDCVSCGQCIKACPVGALTIKTNVTDVWEEIYDPEKIVVAQVAPAVRVSLGEYFGEKPGVSNMGKIATALRLLGFDRVYDTCFAADFTVVEEGKEFLERYEKGERLPLFTSCCPAWVKFVEQYYPEMLLDNLSTAKSPMQMFGSLCKEQLSKELGLPREKIVVVGILPCTAKKFEAAREEFRVNGNPDVDHVLTTEELARMIKAQGIDFVNLEFGSLDMPLSFSTGGAIIFGSSGGLCEAVLRFAADTLEGGGKHREFKQFRGSDGIKIGEIEIGGKTLRLGVVSGLANARKLIEKIKNGEERFDLVEVMACSGGCVNGGGQPINYGRDVNKERAQGLFDNDRRRQLHVSSENPFVQKIYSEGLDEKKAHKLLHTKYKNRRRV